MAKLSTLCGFTMGVVWMFHTFKKMTFLSTICRMCNLTLYAIWVQQFSEVIGKQSLFTVKQDKYLAQC